MPTPTLLPQVVAMRSLEGTDIMEDRTKSLQSHTRSSKSLTFHALVVNLKASMLPRDLSVGASSSTICFASGVLRSSQVDFLSLFSEHTTHRRGGSMYKGLWEETKFFTYGNAMVCM